ncbi:unnamed protein product [Sphagnum jensenii]
MKAAGWTTVAHSDGITKTASGTNNNDSWGSNSNPSNDTYPSGFETSQAPWIVMSGPKTLKIPLSSAPTGTPLRGETINQATSSAEGELLGYVWSVADSSGWMIILPRVGTFDSTHVITGASSSATLTPTGTLKTYSREVMFGKTTASDTVSGQVYYVCCDPIGEASSLFSYLATQSGCTATVPPGSGGTNNGFPTYGNTSSPTNGAIAIKGTGGSTTTNYWFTYSSGFIGNAQIACVNATPATGISADGSFYVALDSTNGSSSLSGIGYQRIDDGEPGDVDPYLWIYSEGSYNTSWSRTTPGDGSNNTFTAQNIFGNYPPFAGYTARGVTVNSSNRDIANGFRGAISAAPGSSTPVFMDNTSTVKTWNHPSSSSPPIVRENVVAYSNGNLTNTFHQIKGRFRWMFCNSIGQYLGTSDSNTFLCVSTANSSYPAIYIGPYDGASTPT